MTSAAAAKPIKRTRPRAAVAKKRDKPVAALRANVNESVSTEAVKTEPSRDKKAAPPHLRVKARKPARAQRPKSPPPTRKSVAKVAHAPSRVGHAAASFADRIATFARAARRKHPAARTAHLRSSPGIAVRRSTKKGGR